MNIKNLKVVAAGLCLGVTLLTGCGNTSIDSKITIVDNKVEGNLSYQDLDKYVKIVSFDQNNKKTTMLFIKTNNFFYNNYTSQTIYTDLMSGVSIIEYETDKYGQITYKLGESLSIKEELPIIPYLISENFVKDEYTVEELIEFFNEKVKPNLDTKEKELVK